MLKDHTHGLAAELTPQGANTQAAAQRIKGPLTPLEAAQIAAGLAYYGKQPRRWEMIVQQWMPYRCGVTA